jgi:hypothetical protein
MQSSSGTKGMLHTRLRDKKIQGCFVNFVFLRGLCVGA